MDDNLAQSEAVLTWAGGPVPLEIRVDAARGSPQHPLTDEQLGAKVRSLAGIRLDGALDHPARPAAEVLALVEET